MTASQILADSRKAKIKSVRIGILWMLATTFLFVAQDSTTRVLLQTYPVMEVAWARYFVHVLAAAGFVAWRHPSAAISRRPWLQIARSSLILAVTLLAALSIGHMRFVDFTAIIWVTPVLVTALSVFMLHEKVGISGWVSVALGMTGVLVIVNPAGIDFSYAMLFPMMGALTNALYQITTRMLHFADRPLTTFFYTGLVGAIICSATLPFIGIMPNLHDGFLMLILGALGGASHYCLIRAFTAAPANVIAPYGYSSLVWATLFSLTLFSEVPSFRTMTGAGLIVAGGLFNFLRKRGA
jgi:drug/metabolite transporter (DMT)-like permease